MERIDKMEDLQKIHAMLLDEFGTALYINKLNRHNIIRMALNTLSVKGYLYKPETMPLIISDKQGPEVEFSYPHDDMMDDPYLDCLTCGATVRSSKTEIHTQYHNELWRAFLR